MIVLGSTGSVGEQAIDVAQKFGVTVDAISAHKNVKRAEEQARAFKVKACAMSDLDTAKDLKERLSDTDIKVYFGTEGICEMVSETNSDSPFGQVVENSIVGEAGLKPTLATLNAKKKRALANKESLVVGGETVAVSGAGERQHLVRLALYAIDEIDEVTAEEKEHPTRKIM